MVDSSPEWSVELFDIPFSSCHGITMPSWSSTHLSWHTWLDRYPENEHGFELNLWPWNWQWFHRYLWCQASVVQNVSHIPAMVSDQHYWLHQSTIPPGTTSQTRQTLKSQQRITFPILHRKNTLKLPQVLFTTIALKQYNATGATQENSYNPSRKDTGVTNKESMLWKNKCGRTWR